jgi:hypothetical protein
VLDDLFPRSKERLGRFARACYPFAIIAAKRGLLLRAVEQEYPLVFGYWAIEV